MDVKEFQRKLEGLMLLAAENGKVLTGEQIVEYFDETLNEDQLLLIFQYLKEQGVTVEGADLQEFQETETETGTQEADPLSEEEERFFQRYLDGLSGKEEREGEKEALFSRAAAGDGEAVGRLTEIYLPLIASQCRDNHREELFIGDMIQDVSLNLYLALDKGILFNDGKVRQLILGEIRNTLETRENELFQDEYLITKVRNLEAAVKELTDGEEDDEKKFSLEELSLLLDMTTEEILDILRLTGDDKEEA